MVWTMYDVSYELRSPLHIGYHKVGNVLRTRYYLPARNLWGAVTEALTRRGFATQVLKEEEPNVYLAVGKWVKDHCAFGYWFIQANDKPLFPHYEGNTLKYGNLTPAEFERRYLDSHVTTALDPSTTSAEEGGLHEVEFIAPYHPVKPGEGEQATATAIGGWVFLDETALPVLGEESKWRAWLGDVQVGGERRYGFGRLRLSVMARDQAWPGYEVDLTASRPLIRVRAGEPLWAHAVAGHVEGGVAGMIEALVGRVTDGDSRGFGQRLTDGTLCWAPGSLVIQERRFSLDEMGLWASSA